MRKSKLCVVAMCIAGALLLGGCGKEEKKEAEVLTTAQTEQSPSASEEGLEESDLESPESLEEEKTAGFTSFQTWDFAGNEVTEDIFADYDLTMINIWATFCNPCLKEMPDLGEIHAEYKEKGVQVVGIVVDLFNSDGTVSEEQFQLATEIVAATKADYTHLLPSTDLINIKLKDVYSVPETVFVDREGNLVGKSYLGARSKSDWIQIIDELLEEVKKD